MVGWHCEYAEGWAHATAYGTGGLVDALSDLLNTQIDSATLGCERYQIITTG